MLNNTLADGRDFLVGNRFTIADICITYALYLGRTLEVDGKALATSYKPQVCMECGQPCETSMIVTPSLSQQLSKHAPTQLPYHPHRRQLIWRR